jgi:hypothetical protein
LGKKEKNKIVSVHRVTPGGLYMQKGLELFPVSCREHFLFRILNAGGLSACAQVERIFFSFSFL